jgi:tetratricopeptide (TPR) repeat protein
VTDREAFADALRLALEAEASGEWLRSHALCDEALRHVPEEPDALNLLGRLCGIAGDASRAIALQSFVLHLDPVHTRAASDLANARRAVASPGEAQVRFDDAIALEPDVTCHQRHFLARWPFVGMDRVEAGLRRTLALDPSHADAHAALGNLLSRRDERGAAIVAYSLAVMLRWEFPEAHLALADLLDAIREEAMARRHRVEALAQRQIFPACAGSSKALRRVLVLSALGGAIENAPFDLVVNPARTALHRHYFVDGAQPANELPAYDVVFNGIEELEASATAIEAAARFVDTVSVRVVNHPRLLRSTRRSELSKALDGIPGCVVPPTVRLERERLEAVGERAEEVAGVSFPLVVRPIDTHRGEGLEYVADGLGIREYLQRHAGRNFNVAPFVDYRSGDGYYRKYRAIVVDGRPLPYHLAISDRWMVHYIGSLMPDHEWMRREEECFLAEPAAVFPHWDDVLGNVARALGLDYFGVDCARLGDGTLLVFECNAGMLVHCRDDAALFAYKYRYVPRIFDAVDRLLDDRVAR